MAKTWGVLGTHSFEYSSELPLHGERGKELLKGRWPSKSLAKLSRTAEEASGRRVGGEAASYSRLDAQQVLLELAPDRGRERVQVLLGMVGAGAAPWWWLSLDTSAVLRGTLLFRDAVDCDAHVLG